MIWKKQSDLEKLNTEKGGQDLGADETVPLWHKNGGTFDASIEEVWHLISNYGYAKVYPASFGEKSSLLTEAMDKSRGGHFEKIPTEYPQGAWYRYEDETCNYECMVSEYFYWSLTSLLGAQAGRYDEISHEWSLNTPELLKEKDREIYGLLTDKKYKLPTKLPDGKYGR